MSGPTLTFLFANAFRALNQRQRSIAKRRTQERSQDASVQRCLDRAFEIMRGRTGLKQGTANTSKKALKPMNRQVLVF